MATRLASWSLRGPLTQPCWHGRPRLLLRSPQVPPPPPTTTWWGPFAFPAMFRSSGSAALAAGSLVRTEAFVGGRWVTRSETGASFAVRDPASGAELSQVADCGVAEAQAAIKAAYEAGAAWSGIPAKVRIPGEPG